MADAQILRVENGKQGPDPQEAFFIHDDRFIAQLNEVRNLKRFLFEEKVKFDPKQLEDIDLGLLNNLRYRSQARPPTLEEWVLLDKKLSALTSYLNDELRQKIRIRELSSFFGSIPLAFLSVATITMVYYFLYPYFLVTGSTTFAASYLTSLIVWSLSQGGLGACAFLGTRAAMKRVNPDNQQTDEFSDITDKNALKVRIVLGCLFGSLIGLPFSNAALSKMSVMLFGDATAKGEIQASDFVPILVPFMVGFSTSLVLAILNRCVLSVRTLLGITSAQ
jgi:hypothetical protein